MINQTLDIIWVAFTDRMFNALSSCDSGSKVIHISQLIDTSVDGFRIMIPYDKFVQFDMEQVKKHFELCGAASVHFITPDLIKEALLIQHLEEINSTIH